MVLSSHWGKGLLFSDDVLPFSNFIVCLGFGQYVTRTQSGSILVQDQNVCMSSVFNNTLMIQLVHLVIFVFPQSTFVYVFVAIATCVISGQRWRPLGLLQVF